MVLMTAVGMTPYQDPTHGQTLYGTFAHFPGLKVVVPSSPYEAKGLMGSAVRSDDPVVYMFHKQLMLGMFDFAEGVRTDVPDGDYQVPIGTADVKRTGADVTVATLGIHVHMALAAAERLDRDGIEAEVLDLRSLVPLDTDALFESVEKTGRLLVVDEDYRSFGVSGELIARVTESRPDALDAASRLASGLPALEDPLFLAPDESATGLTTQVRDAHGAGTIDYFEKHRDRETGEVTVRPHGTTARGRDVVVVDDIVATGSTMSEAVAALDSPARIVAACVHPVLASNAHSKLAAAGVERLVATDTVERAVSTVSAAPAVAELL
jgi:hypothetical protein